MQIYDEDLGTNYAAGQLTVLNRQSYTWRKVGIVDQSPCIVPDEINTGSNETKVGVVRQHSAEEPKLRFSNQLLFETYGEEN